MSSSAKEGPYRVTVRKNNQHVLNPCGQPHGADRNGLAVRILDGEPIWIPPEEGYESFWLRWGQWQELRAAQVKTEAAAVRDAERLSRMGVAERETTMREKDLRETPDHHSGWCVNCGNPLPAIGDICPTCLHASIDVKDPWWLRALRWVMR